MRVNVKTPADNCEFVESVNGRPSGLIILEYATATIFSEDTILRLNMNMRYNIIFYNCQRLPQCTMVQAQCKIGVQRNV